MKKIYSIIALMVIGLAVNAQIVITYKVDITDYLAAGNVLGANGIRIGGNFGDTGGGIAQWAPSDASCAMTDEGGGVWSIAVTYPNASIGMTQQFKFVNNDWGTNEGTDAANTIGADGCGTDDGAGNVNRTMLIPEISVGYQYCWDHCFRCDGSDPLIVPASINETPINFTNVAVSPNPASGNVNVNFYLTNGSEVSFDVYSVTGQLVKSVANSYYAAGTQTYNMTISDLNSGLYLVAVRDANNTVVSSIIVE